MPDTVTVVVNGVSVTMPAGSMVSAAILKTGVYGFRRSVSGGRPARAWSSVAIARIYHYCLGVTLWHGVPLSLRRRSWATAVSRAAASS